MQYHRTLVLGERIIGGVEAILDTVVSELLDNPDRTFVIAGKTGAEKGCQPINSQ